MRLKFKVLLLFLFFSAAASPQAAKIQAMFIYNFTKYIDWPESSRSNSFVIGVLNDVELYTRLTEVVAGKKMNALPIVVNKLTNSALTEQIHILFVGASQCEKLPSICNKLEDREVLIISNCPDGIDHGAAISFVVVANKQRFSLSRQNFVKHKLQMKPELENFALKVK
ncbi:MAG: YfiR family protein [Salinivirgaceae bacterium]|jgi:hypothetical protein|nr:YfiR family protein [Salinivirgaceae bacterium]